MGFFEPLKEFRKWARSSQFVTDEWAIVDLVNFAAYSAVMVLTVLCFRKGLYSYQLKQISWTAVILAFIVVQLKCIIYTTHEGLIWTIFPASMIMMNDTSAYFCGKAFGRRCT